MCYSAICWADYKQYLRRCGAELDIHQFAKLFGHEPSRKRNVPKALEDAFASDETPDARQIWSMIEARRREDIRTWQEEMFTQTRRVADAERAIASGKVTKKAQTDVRVGHNRIKQLQRWMADADRSKAKPEDSRIYAGDYAPVMIWEDGRRVVKPMRFKCRLIGWPEDVDKVKKGTYNARRDSLATTWRQHWGKKHAVIVITSFFEHVWQHQAEGRELAPGEEPKDVVIEFQPNVGNEMYLACLWSDWGGTPDDPLLSFAFITDEPPPEVRAAGHDRCVIPIKRDNVDAWLQPNGDTAAMDRILDDRERPYYEHEITKAA